MTGTCYLLEALPGLPTRPGVMSAHYIGWTSRTVEQRLAEHATGHGCALVHAWVLAGLKIRVTRTWEGVDRNFERQLKNRRNARLLCPACNPNGVRA